MSCADRPLIAASLLLFVLTLTACSSQPYPPPRHMIDTHIHLYDTRRPGGVPWPPKTEPALYKPTLPYEFHRVAEPAGVTGVVIVEASDRPEDNDWVLDLVGQDDYFVGLVGNLNLDMPNDEFEAAVARLVRRGLQQRATRGVRLVGLRLRQPSGGPVKLDNPHTIRNLRTMVRANLTLDILLKGFSVEDVITASMAVPDLKIVVNHVLAYRSDGQPVLPVFAEQVRALAARPNVYVKVSGLYSHSVATPTPTGAAALPHYQPLLDTLYMNFGSKRLIFGTNWPVTKKHGSYDSFVELVDAYFSTKGREARERYFWKNAVDAYRLKLE
ncbi:MAG: amidohydrolase family protein [Planctomycetota bacterium]|jgi:predicted TIM-barrel fold metal-dependent hydrolase